MTCGAIILKESDLYTTEELLTLVGYMLLCVIGVVLLVNKIACFNRLFGSNKEIETDKTPIINIHLKSRSQISLKSLNKKLNPADNTYIQSSLLKVKDLEEREDVENCIYLIIRSEQDKEFELM